MPAETRPAEARRLVRAHVAPFIEQATAPHGFRFLLTGPQFRRDLDGTTHQILLGYDVAPTYAPGALAVLQPVVRVEYAETKDILKRPDVRGSGASVGQPLVFVMARPLRKQWELVDKRSAEAAGIELASIVSSHAVPLLDALRGPDQLVVAFERSDPRISWHDQTVAGVIATYLIRERLDEARALAAKRFPGPVLAAVYPEIERIISVAAS